MRILVIEDDIFISDLLIKNLGSESFAIDVEKDGENGSYIARTNDYDLVLLDLLLPRRNGLQICRDIRAAGKTMPIIVLSIKNTPNFKIELLNAGADDYLSKPFSFEELLARVRAILRRPTHMEAPILIVGPLVLDQHQQTVLKAGKEIYITRKEFALLEYLMKNKNNVVSRGMIMEHVWNSESDPFSNTIEAHILNLRKKIDSDGGPKYIYNVPGRGYKICDPR